LEFTFCLNVTKTCTSYHGFDKVTLQELVFVVADREFLARRYENRDKGCHAGDWGAVVVGLLNECNFGQTYLS
jgi:hypothetical protein